MKKTVFLYCGPEEYDMGKKHAILWLAVATLIGEKPLEAKHTLDDGRLTITLDEPFTLKEGDVIEATIGMNEK